MRAKAALRLNSVDRVYDHDYILPRWLASNAQTTNVRPQQA